MIKLWSYAFLFAYENKEGEVKSMMNYGMSNINPYLNPQQMNNLMNQYPQYFSPAMQQNFNPQQQQQITTQPPIMQPANNTRNTAKMVYVGNKEEATAMPVDLVYNTPTFFYNRGTNEVYMKQYDSPTGNAIFKTFAEIQPIAEQATAETTNPYQRELKSIREGIDGLYRILLQPQIPQENVEVEIEQQPRQQRRENRNGNHK